MEALTTEQLVHTDSYYMAFKRAVWFLSQQSGGFAFAAAQPQMVIEEICRQLQERLGEQGLPIAIVHLQPEDDRPFIIQLQQAAQNAHALIIANLGTIAAIHPERLYELNFAREELFALSKPLLFFLFPNQTPLITRKAGDLYSQRAITTTFFELPNRAYNGIIPDQPLQWLEQHTEVPDKEALTLRIALLEKHLEEAEAMHLSPKGIAVDTALPLAETYARLGAHEKAQQLIDKYAGHFPKTAKTYQTLAAVERRANRYEEAIAYYQKALENTQQPVEIADIKDDLAGIYRHLGNYAEARHLLEEALALTVQELGENHPNTAIRYSNLAIVLQDLGDYQGAKDLLEKAVASDEKNFGTDHPTTAIRYSNLAGVLYTLGDYQGAKDLLEKAVASDEKNLGTDHPTTAISYSNLALVLQDLGDYQGAKDLFEKALQSAEKNFGTDHPTTAQSYSNLATVLQALGDYQGAKDLLEKAVASDEKNLGTDHPNTAIRYSNLALVLKDLGDYQGAKDLLEKAVASNEKNFGTDHPTTAISYSNLALVLKDLGDYQGAKDLLEKAVASDEKNLGTDHPTTAIRYSNLATVLKALGDYQGAFQLAAKAYHTMSKHVGDRHPNTKHIEGVLNGITAALLQKGWTEE
jgi:tetratricopeptide (TPR) repeat protein